MVLTTGEDFIGRVQAALHAAGTSTVHLSAPGTTRSTYPMTHERTGPMTHECTGRGWQTGLERISYAPGTHDTTPVWCPWRVPGRATVRRSTMRICHRSHRLALTATLLLALPVAVLAPVSAAPTVAALGTLAVAGTVRAVVLDRQQPLYRA